MSSTPKFSPSLYGPFYKNRPELTEDRYNVSHDTNQDPPSVGYTNRSEESRFTFNGTPDNAGNRSTGGKNSSASKFSPSLYGPFYKNRENLAEDRYNNATPTTHSVEHINGGNRNTTEARSSRNGTWTTYQSDPGRSSQRRVEELQPGSVRTTTTNNLSPRTNESVEYVTESNGHVRRVAHNDTHTTGNRDGTHGTRQNTTSRTSNRTPRPAYDTSTRVDVRDLNVSGPYVRNGGNDHVAVTNSKQTITKGNQGYINVDPAKGEVVNTTMHTEPDGTRVETQTIKHVIQHLAGVDLGLSMNSNRKTTTTRRATEGIQHATTNPVQRSTSRVLKDPDGEVVNTTIHTEPDGTRIETQTLKHVIQHIAGLDMDVGAPTTTHAYHPTTHTTNRNTTRQQAVTERKVITEHHPPKGVLKNTSGEVVKTTVHTEPDGTRIETQTIKNVVQHMTGLKFDESDSDVNSFRYNRTPNSQDDSFTSTTSNLKMRRRSPQHGELLPRISESGGIEQYSVSRRDRPAAAHDNWPIYKYQRGDGVSVMVRSTPGKINEVKNHLRLTDGLGPDQLALMPALPAMEFDADEQVSLNNN